MIQSLKLWNCLPYIFIKIYFSLSGVLVVPQRGKSQSSLRCTVLVYLQAILILPGGSKFCLHSQYMNSWNDDWVVGFMVNILVFFCTVAPSLTVQLYCELPHTHSNPELLIQWHQCIRVFLQAAEL